MKELFQWVPWFGELAKAVGEGRREGLVEAAKNVDWAGGKCVVLAQGEEKADPLTFFYHLGAIAKSKRRETVYASVAEAFGIESDLDYSLDSGFIFPTPDPRFVMFTNSEGPELFWEMFDRARGQDGTSYGADIADTFTRTLQIKGVGVPKLTQVLFLINPRVFLPFDAAAVLPLGIGTLKKNPAKMSWAEYVDEMGRIRTAFPGCQPYEINVIGYLWTSGEFPRKGNRWYQIGTGEDGWPDFRDNHCVHLDGQGDMDRPAEGEILPAFKQDDGFDEPEPGDVVLVRTGTQEGRGIGIVYRNDYGERPHQNRRIHVLWVNKERAPLAAKMPAVRFSRVGRTAYKAFARSAAYSATLDLLQPPTPGTGGSGLEEKNINTLYAEFYQPLVARLQEKGVQPVGSIPPMPARRSWPGARTTASTTSSAWPGTRGSSRRSAGSWPTPKPKRSGGAGPPAGSPSSPMPHSQAGPASAGSRQGGAPARQVHPRFVVTSLPDTFSARTVYDVYCPRGNMEAIKEQQLDLFSDRTSASRFAANQLRLLFSAFASILFQALRRALHGTPLARATARSASSSSRSAPASWSRCVGSRSPWTPHTRPPPPSHASTPEYQGNDFRDTRSSRSSGDHCAAGPKKLAQAAVPATLASLKHGRRVACSCSTCSLGRNSAPTLPERPSAVTV